MSKWSFSVRDVVWLLTALLLNFVLIRMVIDRVQSPEVYDALFNILPHSTVWGVLAWGVVINILLAVYAFLKYPSLRGFAMRTVALMYILRAFFISVTVLGVPAARMVPHPNNFLFQMAYNGNDFFFSGHVALPFILALIFWENTALRVAFLCMSFVFAGGALLARTHYSIDVFAAPIISYAVFTFAKRFLDDKEAQIDYR